MNNYKFGTPKYAAMRSNPDEQDGETLDCLTDWLVREEPFCHLRVANGEFMSIFRRDGDNGGEHDYLGATVGADLHQMLVEIANQHPHHGRLLVGGIWEDPAFTRAWLEWHEQFARIPWVPCQVFVNGIIDRRTMRWMRALAARGQSVILVVNDIVAKAAVGLGARVVVEIPRANSFAHRASIEERLRAAIRPSDVVVYCGGFGVKSLIWRMWRSYPRTSHVDMGHFFDGAFGVRSRSWLAGTPDERSIVYDTHYAPRIRGEVPWAIGDAQ